MRDAFSQPGRTAVAAVAVAATYAYFLLFPQFAFLHALREAGAPAGEVRALMGVMAFGGVAASLFAGRTTDPGRLRRLMTGGALLCAAAAAIFARCGGANGAALNAGVALGSGAGLGLLTVALAASLRGLCGPASVALACGAGTGVAYALVNLPALFNAPPVTQAGVSAAFAALLPVALWRAAPPKPEPEMTPGLAPAGFRRGLALFLVLVWMDSACFAIIQETEVLKRATWGRDADLVCNGLMHLGAALVTGIFARPRHFAAWLTGSLGLLLAAALLLDAGGAAAARAHPLYAAGVSVYSTLLVAWLPLAHGPRCARRVATLYAFAGWFGSAMGVGMALDLHRIPGAFLAAAALVFAGTLGVGAPARIGGDHDHA